MTNDVTRRPWWRWMAGMVDQHGRRVIEVGAGRNEAVPVEWSDAIACDVVEMYEHPDDARAEWEDAIPDPTDPATLGCLLALARELWVDCWLWLDVDTLGIMRRVRVWRGTGYPVGTVATGDTEWSALVAACDAAWGRR